MYFEKQEGRSELWKQRNKLMSRIKKLLGVVETRLKSDMNIYDQQYGFRQKKTTDAMEVWSGRKVSIRGTAHDGCYGGGCQQTD